MFLKGGYPGITNFGLVLVCKADCPSGGYYVWNYLKNLKKVKVKTNLFGQKTILMDFSDDENKKTEKQPSVQAAKGVANGSLANQAEYLAKPIAIIKNSVRSVAS